MGLSFAFPLIALLAASAVGPALIHLRFRQRAPEVPFSSLRFLEATLRTGARGRRLKEILLFLLRTVLLLLLPLALARPFLAGVGAGPPERVVLVVDDSYSMRAPGRFARLVRRTQEVLEGLGSTSRVWVLPSSTGGRSQPRWLPPEEASREVSALVPGTRRGVTPAACRRALEVLQKERGRRRELFVVSDFQLSEWEQVSPSGESSSGESPSQAFLRRHGGKGGPGGPSLRTGESTSR